MKEWKMKDATKGPDAPADLTKEQRDLLAAERAVEKLGLAVAEKDLGKIKRRANILERAVARLQKAADRAEAKLPGIGSAGKKASTLAALAAAAAMIGATAAAAEEQGQITEEVVIVLEEKTLDAGGALDDSHAASERYAEAAKAHFASGGDDKRERMRRLLISMFKAS